MPYRNLNRLIEDNIAAGVRHFLLENVIGQRYIGVGLDSGIKIEIRGIPGQDLGVFMGGAEIVVHGNAQDGVGNTMNDGFLVIHGNVGDIPGHMVRNGKIYIKGSAGYRVGIMMKEYQQKQPLMIIGEKTGDYLGEYMAGGTVVVLGYNSGLDETPVGRHTASGIFGGKIFIRGKISRHQLGEGTVLEKAGPADLEKIIHYLREFAGIFDLDLNRILDYPFSIIKRAGERPYGDLYVPGNKISRNLKPLHRNLEPPCSSACPVGIPNPVIIRKLKGGLSEEAFDQLDDYTPFRYSCCGLVCPGLCRTACTRNSFDGPVRIDEIARDYHPTERVKRLEGLKIDKIVIIGAGPAGLAAAWHLARRGYPVDVYEKEKDLGGKLTHNIPEERLTRENVERDLKRIRSLKINFITDTEVDKKLFKRFREEYRAVIIAVGAQNPKRLGFPGEEKAFSSFHFLRSLKAGSNSYDLAGKEVLILGAGNVAMDVACECHRLGAAAVTAADVRKPTSFGREVERARSLGTKILFPWFIESYRDGMAYFKNGKRLKADFLIEAVGETPELLFLSKEMLVSGTTFTTNIPKVYAAGDAVAPGLVTHSLGMGRKVAGIIHKNLQGIPTEEETPTPVEKKRINLLYFRERNGFSSPLDDCLSCGTCIQCDICIESCPRKAVSRVDESFKVDQALCSGCGACASVCPRGAVTMIARGTGV